MLACSGSAPQTKQTPAFAGEKPPELTERPWGVSERFIEALPKFSSADLENFLVESELDLTDERVLRELREEESKLSVKEEQVSRSSAFVTIENALKDGVWELRFKNRRGRWKIVDLKRKKGRSV